MMSIKQLAICYEISDSLNINETSAPSIPALPRLNDNYLHSSRALCDLIGGEVTDITRNLFLVLVLLAS